MPPSSLLRVHARRADVLDRVFGAFISTPTPSPHSLIQAIPLSTTSNSGTPTASPSTSTTTGTTGHESPTSIPESSNTISTPTVTPGSATQAPTSSSDVPSSSSVPSSSGLSRSQSSSQPSGSSGSLSLSDTASLTNITNPTPIPGVPPSRAAAGNTSTQSPGLAPNPTSLPHPPDMPSTPANAGNTISAGALSTPETSSGTHTSAILAGVFGGLGGLLILILLFICVRRYSNRRSSSSSVPTWDSPAQTLPSPPVSSSQFPPTPTSGASSTHHLAPTPTSPSNLGLTRTQTQTSSDPVTSPSASSLQSPQSLISQMSTSRHANISPLLLVNTSRFSAQNGRYTFDTSPTRGRDSPLDPFADPYAGMRRTVYTQDVVAETPTIHVPRDRPFGFGSRPVSVPSPLAGPSQTTGSNSITPIPEMEAEPEPEAPSPGGEDLANIGLAAMLGVETPKLAPANLATDPFGTPKSNLNRLSHMSLDADVDWMVTPPSPVSSQAGYAA